MTHRDPFSLESQYIVDDDDDELDRGHALADWDGTASQSSSEDSAILTPPSPTPARRRRARSQESNAVADPSSTVSSHLSHRHRSGRGRGRGAAESMPALLPDISRHHRLRPAQVLELHQHFWGLLNAEAEAAGAVSDADERYDRAMGRSELVMWILAVVTAGFVGWRIGRG